MAYFEDLTPYEYRMECSRPGTKNIGWLGEGHAFAVAEAGATFLEALWRFCKVSVVQTRGLHVCEMCDVVEACFARRGDESLMLGFSEIRVFAANGDIFAAPTLIYHYVAQHQYAPPASFVASVLGGPAPPDGAYFERLEAIGLEWKATSPPGKIVHPR
jgi:hypothetical protein